MELMDKLKGVLPSNIYFEMIGTIERFSINTPLRASHFLAQCKHESGNFNVTKENLNYSAQGLMTTFPKYFPNIDIANQYKRQPEKIANKVYALRNGNGDESSGDGSLFSGKGFIQLTGRSNFQSMSTCLNDPDIMKNPNLLATNMKYACLSAGYFWDKNKLNVIADTGSSDEVIKQITIKINGGIIGLSDRIINFNQIYPLLNK